MRRNTRQVRTIAIVLVAGLWLSFAHGGVAVADDVVALPEPREKGGVSVEEALSTRRSVREFAKRPLSLVEIAQLLWAAQGTTDSRGYRTAPSAGALYPLEIYLVAGAVTGLEPGVYRYEPAGHRLTRRQSGDLRRNLARAAFEQDWVAQAPAILVIAAVPARSARKYGRRAPRYVRIETGHAAQNVYLQAEALGLGTCAVGAFDDGRLARVLELPKNTSAELVMPVGWPASGSL